jgi:hypothetical protein
MGSGCRLDRLAFQHFVAFLLVLFYPEFMRGLVHLKVIHLEMRVAAATTWSQVVG